MPSINFSIIMNKDLSKDFVSYTFKRLSIAGHHALYRVNFKRTKQEM